MLNAQARRWPRGLAVVLAAGLAAALAGCGDPTKKERAAAPAAARVNGEPIQLAQIDLMLQSQRGLRPEQAEAASKVLLERLINQEVAAQRAADAERARARGTVDDAMLTTVAKDPKTIGEGKETFASTCAPCHRADGGGNIGPNLTDGYWLHGNKPSDIYKTVTEGVPAKGMPTWGPVLGEERVEQVVAYVLSIEGTNVTGGKAPQGELASR